MKTSLFGLLFFLTVTGLNGQATDSDTTIYNVAEQMPYPLLKSCRPDLHTGWTEDSVRRCAEIQLLTILSQNIRYPEEARKNNKEGTVVVTFVVEPEGKMSNYQILKDIGDGCGAEALRVLQALEEVGLRWQPAKREGKVVRMRQSMPLRFKLQEALPYYVDEQGDSIYTSYDTAPEFRGGMDSLVSFALNQLQYPPDFADSCKTGVIEMSLIIWNDGSVQVENQLDFSNLGSEFQFQALRLVNRTEGYWTPAQYQGKAVTTTLPFRVLFKSDRKGCAAANAQFDKATILANEGATFFEQEKPDEAIRKWTEALALQPDNTEWLYYRGTALLNTDHKEEACKDFNRVKEILGITWFEAVRKLVCGW